MKHMNRIFALALALIMVLGLATTAYAATVTVDKTGHTFAAYQILSGSQSATEAALGNVAWGTGIIPATFIEKLKADTTVGTIFADVTDAKTFAAAMATITGDSDEAKAVAAIADECKSTTSATLVEGENNLADGYYLIVDTTTINGHDSANAALLEVTRDITIADKSAKPTFDKQVQDEVADDDVDTTSADGWGETADHAIGESFQFKLTATLPTDADFDAYESYKIVFTDTMSAGITFESIQSVKVNTDNVDANDYVCTAKNGDAGTTWTLTIADITKYDTNLADGAVVEVIYKAHLNENAVVGNKDDNKNTAHLQYSNNPNVGGENSLGQTTDDTVWVFTYEMKNTKTDGTNRLAGATFAIKNAEGKYYGGVVDGVVTWVDSDKPVEDTNVAKFTSAATTGDFTIKGLDVGTYKLVEIVTPAGYNTCADITVVISAAHKEKNATSAETVITMTKDGTAATEIIVVNQAGSTLPETGGMGTTLFYVIGGLLVAAAVVLLVSKKRMTSAE